MDDKEIMKKRAVKISMGFAILLIILLTYIFISLDNTIPWKVIVVSVLFELMVIASLAIGIKYKDTISKPETQRTLGLILVGLACLQMVLFFIADLLEKKIITFNLLISIIVFGVFLTIGVLIIKKSKEKQK